MITPTFASTLTLLAATWTVLPDSFRELTGSSLTHGLAQMGIFLLLFGVGITARVLRDHSALDSRSGHLILAMISFLAFLTTPITPPQLVWRAKKP